MDEKASLAVILHADVADSTALVRADELAAHKRIQEVFRALAEAVRTHNGVPREVRGDAVVAEFSRPSDAVSAAMGFQETNSLQEGEDLAVRLRIGIAMGEVVISERTITGAGVVLAQRLEQLAPPGGVTISAAVREAISGAAAFRYTDLGDHVLKGFEEPCRVYRVHLGQPVSGRKDWATRPDGVGDTSRSFVGVAGPRVAVLPLRNLSTDPDQEFFADGLSEEITLALSASRSFPVLASSATLRYKERSVSVNAAGRELGAQYVLDGSVRRAGDRIRISVELVEVESQVQVWSERYDRTLDDIFEIQDEITTTLVAIVEPEIDEQEMRRVLVAKPSNLSSYELAQRGFWHLAKRTFADYKLSCPLFDDSLKGDGRYARAYAGLSQGKYMAGANLWEQRSEALHAAVEFGRAALEIDGRDPRGLRYCGGANIALGNLDEGISMVKRAISMQPSYATAYSVLAFGLCLNGNFEDAISAVDTTVRLRPGDRALSKCIISKASAAYQMGDYETAEQVCQRSEEIDDGFWMTHAVRAAAVGQLSGQSERSESALARLRVFLPTPSAGQLAGLFPFRSREHVEHLIAGLGKAGLRLANP